MSTTVTPGRYRHYKGGLYEVVGLARHSETEEPLVVYRALASGGSLWVRPAAMFAEEVEVAGRRVPRFERLDRAAGVPASFVQANTCGHLHDAREASVSPLDRAFLYGDAVYEVWRTAHGVLFATVEHWERLNRSADALGITLPWDLDTLLAEIRRTTGAYREATGHAGDLNVRLQVSRGAGPITIDPGAADKPNWVVFARSLAPLGTAPLRLTVTRRLRRNHPLTLNPLWKTGNYLNNLMCFREAKERGADDVVILNLAGEVAEASLSNVAFARGGVVVTPPLGAGMLEGVTRGQLIGEVARRAGVAVVEERVTEADLGSFDEAFLVSTTRGAQGVATIDGWSYRTGAGTVQERLQAAFQALQADYAAANPRFRA